MDLVDLLDTTPETVWIDGKLKHRWADGTITPVVRGGDGDDPDPEKDKDKGFRPINSQEELDRVVRDRIDRAKREALQGVPSAEELAEIQRKAKEYDDAQAANQSELEKERTRADTAEKAARDAAAAAARIAKRAAIVAQASKAGAVDPDVVADLLASNDAVTIDDAGQVTGADTAVKTLLEEKSYLAGNGSGGSVDSGQGRDRGDRGGKASGLAAGRERYEARHGAKK